MSVYKALWSTSQPALAPFNPKYGLRFPPDAVELLKTALSKALRQNARRADVMAVTGHDLRQPLHVLSMLLETIALQSRHAEAAAQATLARRAIRRMADGLDQLALASRADADIGLAQACAFPVAEVLRSLEPTWGAHAGERQVHLRVISSSAWVCSERSLLTTILDNLIDNAIKYSAQRRILIGCRRKGNLLSIRVLDQGMGIAEDRLQRLVAAFHQGDRSSVGMDLGLSIVRLTAAALGHRVEVASRFGRGTAFSVTVPLARARETA